MPEPDSPSHGLTPNQLSLIQQVLAPFADRIDRVCLFGSRAKGTHRPNSDVDLVLYGHLDEPTLDRLWTLFDESSLPFKVDVTADALVTYPPLKAHIERARQVLFEKSDLMNQPTTGL